MPTEVFSALGYRFRDPRLLVQALTHRSAGRQNNERLEFLGDALINLIVAELIYEQYPRADEGEMTRLRASLVSGEALARLARAQTLGDALRLGPGELKSGGFRRESILADAFEAIVAAVYLDAGWDACRELMRTLFAPHIAAAQGSAPKDAKTRLQELLQAHALGLPVYALVASKGEDHAKIFETTCSIDALGIKTDGRGPNRRAAEQAAAEMALVRAEEKLADAH